MGFRFWISSFNLIACLVLPLNNTKLRCKFQQGKRCEANVREKSQLKVQEMMVIFDCSSAHEPPHTKDDSYTGIRQWNKDIFTPSRSRQRQRQRGKNVLGQRSYMRSSKSKSGPSDQILYVCDQCNKSFTYKVTLLFHLRLHSGKKPYKCLVCGERFFLQSTLSLHLRTHTSVKRHNNHLGENLSGNSSVNQQGQALSGHVERNSNTDKHGYMGNYECEFYKKSFAAKRNLTVHRRTHTGENPFKYVCCKKSFATKY